VIRSALQAARPQNTFPSPLSAGLFEILPYRHSVQDCSGLASGNENFPNQITPVPAGRSTTPTLVSPRSSFISAADWRIASHDQPPSPLVRASKRLFAPRPVGQTFLRNPAWFHPLRVKPPVRGLLRMGSKTEFLMSPTPRKGSGYLRHASDVIHCSRLFT